jgi:hypothetical protein
MRNATAKIIMVGNVIETMERKENSIKLNEFLVRIGLK